ncbi:MAG TPA: FAD-dependent oxidoreductase [Armatimonadota bacterium]|jgi:sarcosine oxidase subunit beta|nr:FAD-dependent oxidoreductase [Armatimonadota bacterium]
MSPSRIPDVLIVGGGLIGCASAYYLAKQGHAVTLLERGDIASGASGACDGHVCCQSKTSPTHLALARRSADLYDSLSDELDREIGFRRCGSWLIAETDEELEALTASASAMSELGVQVSIHSGEEIHETEPALSAELAGGSYCPTDGQVDPWRVVLAFAASAKRLGADIRLGTEVASVAVSADEVTGVCTPGGHLPAGSVLLAAGAWTASLCEDVGIDLPVRPRRGEILVSEAMPPLLTSVILHAPYVGSKSAAGSNRAATLVLEQITEGNVLFGSTRSYSSFDARTTPDGLSAIAGEARRLAPGLAGLNVVRTFAGLRPSSPDGLPLIGPLPGARALLIATGHEGDGVALAPVTGETVALGISSGKWPADLLPSRDTDVV